MSAHAGPLTEREIDSLTEWTSALAVLGGFLGGLAYQIGRAWHERRKAQSEGRRRGDVRQAGDPS